MYRELIEKDIQDRGNIVPAGQIFPTSTPHLRYCSLFMFGHDVLTYAKNNKSQRTGKPSVQGYKGKVYCEAVWIDIDYGKDVNEARLSAIQVIKRLNAEYGVNPDHLFIYFSGNKGFHIALHSRLIGYEDNTPIEPDKMKDFVRRLTAGIQHIDFVIYEPVRIFRIENSRHEKSGLYKIRISFDELQCELEDILSLAKDARTYPYKTDFTGMGAKQGLNNLWLNSGNYIQEQKEAEYKGNLFAPPTEGSRNKTLLVQACTLFRKSELSNNAILDIISNAAFIANIGSSDPVDKSELKRIVANAERLVGDERKKATVEELQMKSFGEWIPEWEQYMLQETTPMSLCFSELNMCLKGRLKGKLGVVMGYGGAKKSLYALNLALLNKNELDEVFIYSTMEMSVPQLINRVIDYEVKDPNGGNASDAVVKMYRQDIQKGRQFLKDQLGSALGNRLQIIPNGRMTYQHYKAAIQKCKETVGVPSVLIVDGLSMMGGKGSETDMYNQNSADLKQLANEENIFVLLICHVSKGAEKFTRDLSRWIRGSEKILDNCDFYMTMSQIQDKESPDAFRKDLGFINFNDKRGSGEVKNIVYGFDAARLKLFETNEAPENYYEPLKTNGKKLIEDF